MTDSEKVIWGIGLCGHDFDLEYWRDTFKEPFDPSVTQQANIFVLRSSEFASCDEGVEVAAPSLAGEGGAGLSCMPRADVSALRASIPSR
jgi:hypothetical protein